MDYINDLILIRDHFNPEPLRNARVFVTGVGSWFGKWVTSFMDYSGIQWERWMRPYDRFPTGAFDYIIHLAQSPIEPVLRFAERAQCSAFLFTSSGSLFNPDPDVKSNKVAQEQALMDSGLPYRIARCYSFIGHGSPTRYAAATFIHRALKKQPLTVFNDGASIRTYLYIADLVAWLLTIMADGAQKIYDVGGSEVITILDLARTVNKVTGNRGLMIEPRDGDIRPVYVPDKKLLQNSHALGLKQWTSVEEAVKRSVEAYR